MENEVLAVTSKLKIYVKEKHQLNTAGNVPEKVSELIRKVVDAAAERAKADGRKTLMDRDFES
jgi:histone H3/H4